VRHRGFAGAGGTDQGDGFAGADMEIDMLQRVLVVAGVGEAEVFEFEVAFDVGDRRFPVIEFEVGAFEHFADGADGFESFGDGRNGVHRRHDHGGDRAEVPGQQNDVADADFEQALLVEVGDEDECAEVEQHQQHPVDRAEDRVDPVHLESGVADLFELLVDPADFDVFDVVGAGDRDQPDHFGDPPGHVFDAFAEGAVGLFDPVADRDEESDRERHRRQVEQHEDGSLDQRHDDGDDDCADDIGHRFEQHAGHVLDAFDVAGDLVLERPHPGRGVIGDGEVLKPGAERRAQSHFDRAAGHAHQPDVKHVGGNVLGDDHDPDRQDLPEAREDLILRERPVGDEVDHFGGQDRYQEYRGRLDQVHEPDQDETSFPFRIKTDVVLHRSAVAILSMEQLFHTFPRKREDTAL